MFVILTMGHSRSTGLYSSQNINMANITLEKSNFTWLFFSIMIISMRSHQKHLRNDAEIIIGNVYGWKNKVSARKVWCA